MKRMLSLLAITAAVAGFTSCAATGGSCHKDAGSCHKAAGSCHKAAAGSCGSCTTKEAAKCKPGCTKPCCAKKA